MENEIRLPHKWKPRLYQRAAWEYLANGGRHAELIWHRRSGKDEISLHHTACAMFERTGNYWHMLPEASQARKAIWDAINPHSGVRRIDEAFPPALRSFTRNQDMMLGLKNGSTWQVLGSDNYNSLVGSPPIGVVFSEWALANPSARAYLRPIMLENNGWQLYITTPRGRNHAYRTFNAAKTDPNAFAQVLTAYDTGAMSAERLDEERMAYIKDFGEDQGIALFAQEYECSFDAAILGAVLGRAVERARNENRIAEDIGFDPAGALLELSCDLGFHDTTAFWFWQPMIGGFHVVDFDAASGLDADEWCKRLKKRCDERGYEIGRIYLPHDARARTFASKRNAIEAFLEHFGPERCSVVPQGTVHDRINAARRIMPRCAFALPECEAGLEALASWQFEFLEETRSFSKIPKHDWASHPGDAFSYGAQMLLERVPEEEQSWPPPVSTKPQTIDQIVREHEQRERGRRRRI